MGQYNRLKWFLAVSLVLSSSATTVSWALDPTEDDHTFDYLAEDDASANQDLPPDDSDLEDAGNYGQYADQAMAAFRKGDSTRAITLMQKAYQLSPNNPSVLNNLAACFIQRGVHYQNKLRDNTRALSDYRQALFYLIYEWPEGVNKTATHEANIRIIEANIRSAMANLKYPVNDAQWHLKTAKSLRSQGRLTEAMPEYAWATRLDTSLSDAWLAQGDVYMVRQKPEKAITAYQKAVESSKKPSADMWVKLGTARFKASQSEKAVEALNQATSIDPKNPDVQLMLEAIWKRELDLNPRNMPAHLNLGAVFQQQGRYDEAMAQYQVADRLAPNDALVKLNMGSLYQVKGDATNALAMFDTVLQSNPANTQALKFKAQTLQSLGRTAEAQALLQKTLATSPDKKWAMDELMAMQKGEKDPVKLRTFWEDYTRQFPNDATVQFNAGVALHEVKDYSSAVTFYQRAVNLKPDYAEAWANLGSALHALNRDNEAISALDKAYTLDTKLPEAKSLLDTLQRQQNAQQLGEGAKRYAAGDYEGALSAYQQALNTPNPQAQTWAGYGLTLQALKRYGEARDAYDKALALAPKDGLILYYKGTLAEAVDNLAEAKTMYQKALALDPSLTQARDALSLIQADVADEALNRVLETYNRKQYPQALAQVNSILQQSPQNATAWYYKGLILDARRQLIPAKSAYEKALQLDPGLSDALYALAVVLDTQGQRARAKQRYQQFIDMTQGQPDDEFIQYARQRVGAL